MKNIEMYHLLNLQTSILKYINPKISNHQEEVAYITYRICCKLGYDNKKAIDLVIASLLHDIGSFKINDIDELRKFNSINTLSHAIYGYLFLNKCDNFKHLSEIVLYHHHYYNERNKTIHNINFKEESSLIFLSDRVSVLAATANYDKDNILSTLQNSSDGIFNPKYIRTILELIEQGDLLKQLKTKKYKSELRNVLKKSNMPTFDANSQLIIFPLIIDFFSNKVAMHTIKFYSISKFICEYLVLDEHIMNNIILATFFHDLGELCMLKEIWENKYLLKDSKKNVMKNQLFYTENILRDSYIHQDIVNLACINYENLNSLKNTNFELKLDSIQVKILIASHIFAELVETVEDKNELLDMFINLSNEYELDSNISSIITDNYKNVLEYIYKEELKYEEIFNEINQEASDIFEKFEEVWI